MCLDTKNGGMLLVTTSPGNLLGPQCKQGPHRTFSPNVSCTALGSAARLALPLAWAICRYMDGQDVVLAANVHAVMVLIHTEDPVVGCVEQAERRRQRSNSRGHMPHHRQTHSFAIHNERQGRVAFTYTVGQTRVFTQAAGKRGHVALYMFEMLTEDIKWQQTELRSGRPAGLWTEAGASTSCMSQST
ncbi:hypothetical protein GOODEAATRI_000985 [Goodea atripinnis]|uniref:Uncharacterized protein n=1 Tax=Goodea atripinnis TaxID=208336 RepID=A0ABV0P361_9TELE